MADTDMDLLKKIFKRAEQPAFLDSSQTAPPLTVTDLGSQRFSDFVSGLDASRAIQSLSTVEACHRLLSQSISQAEIEPQNEVTRQLTPDLLGVITRDLLERGNSVLMVESTPMGVDLVPCASYELRGDRDESTWRYRCQYARPDRDHMIASRDASDVLHFRIGADSRQPYRGRAPLDRAKSSLSILYGSELALVGELRLPSFAALLSASELGDEGFETNEQKHVRSLSQRLGAFGEYISPRLSEGGQDLSHDWSVLRVRPEPYQTIAEIRRQAAEFVCAVYQLPFDLIHGARSATASREAYRHAISLATRPLITAIEHEIGRKTMISTTLDLKHLAQSDITAKARALKQLTDAGMNLAEAREVAGI